MEAKTVTSRKGTILIISILFAAFVLLYFPVLKELVLTWMNSDEYSHGFFIIPISGYLIWKKKEIFNTMKISYSWWGLALIILSLLIYLFAYMAEIMTLASISLILFLASIVLFLYNFSALRELVFPIVFLFFMIPIPGQIYSQLTVPLQLFVTEVSVWLTALLGIPIFREGNVIHLPSRTMQVAQACSGLRSMISILPLSAILGYFTMKSNRLRYVLFLSGIPTALIVNIVRVILLVIAYYYFDIDLTVGTIHTVFGIVIFMLALFIILEVRRILVRWEPQ